MTRHTFTGYAWLLMFSAFATVPAEFINYALHERVDMVGATLQGVMQVVGILLYVAITLILKRFLNTVFSFHEVDKNIEMMVIANIVAGMLLVGGTGFPGVRETVDLVVMVIMVVQSVIQILFGYKLLLLPDNLGGLLKPFCYLNMATGLCIASILLVPVGVVLSAISDLMLATIFFNMAKQMKEVGPGR